MDPDGWMQSIESWLLMHGFTDTSWGNDVSPSFHNDERELRLWIDDFDTAKRDGSAPRFELHQYNDGEFTYALGHSETWPAIQTAIEGLLMLSQKYPSQVLGEPTERTDFDSVDLQDIIGFGPDELAISETTIVSVLVYPERLYICKLADGRHWTMIHRSDYLGTLADCEIPLAAFAESEGIGS